MPNVYNRLQSSFLSLALPWSGRSLPKGNQWECWNPGLGPNAVGLPSPPATKYLTNPKPDRLISCHMAGWLVNCTWQARWLAHCYCIKCQPDPPPREIHVLVMGVNTFGHKDLWSDYPPK